MQDKPDQTQSVTDPLDPARARAMEATLGAAPSIQSGDPLPPFFHQLYFWDPRPPQELGRDPEKTIAALLAWATAQMKTGPALIYASARPEKVAAVQAEFGREKAGASACPV